MPLYCSNTGSTALREAEVQQPITAAHLSLTSSFLAFSAKVGQSRGAVFLDELDLAAEHAARGVDLLDRELLGLHRAGFRDRHRAGDRMQDADGDFGVGDRESGGVDRGGRRARRRRTGAAATTSPAAPPSPSAACAGTAITVPACSRLTYATPSLFRGRALQSATIAEVSLGTDTQDRVCCIARPRRRFFTRISDTMAGRLRVAGGSGSTAFGANTTNGLPTRRWKTTRCASPRRARGAGPPPASPTPRSARSRSWRWKRSAAPSR